MGSVASGMHQHINGTRMNEGLGDKVAYIVIELFATNHCVLIVCEIVTSPCTKREHTAVYTRLICVRVCINYLGTYTSHGHVLIAGYEWCCFPRRTGCLLFCVLPIYATSCICVKH